MSFMNVLIKTLHCRIPGELDTLDGQADAEYVCRVCKGPAVQCNVGIIEGPFASRSAAAGDIAASLGQTWQSGQACSGRTDGLGAGVRAEWKCPLEWACLPHLRSVGSRSLESALEQRREREGA